MISNSVFKLSVLALGTVALVACSNSEKKQIAAESYVDWVDPLIGSGGHGHVFVGASIPHGMIQLGPNNNKKGWDWCSGYHDSDSTIIGFAHTHLSGTGIADLGDILLMPAVSVIDSAGYLSSSAYVSTFLKQEELVTPGFYQVKLHPSGVNVELTAGERVGMHRYVYPSDKKAQVVVDLENSAQSLMLREGTISSELQLINDSTVVGVRSSDEWAMNHTVYFRSVFSKPILNSRLYAKEKGKKMVLDFGILQEPLLVKTAVSYVSSEGALANLEAEHRTFDEVHEDAVELWNDALSKIQVEVKDDNVKKMFYTALYHTMISPSVFQDVDGSYKGADGKVYQTSDFVPPNGQAIIGATILEKGTTNGTITDFDGNFELTSTSEKPIIQVSYIGYKTQTITVTSNKPLVVTMKTDAIMLEEAVVIGYAKQKKATLTGAVSSVSSENITKRSVASLSTALQGTMPGVTIQQTSGQPGSDGSTIRVRGIGSINSDQNPLVLVDGIEMDINQVDANTIESVSVLKDAASASIYGSRASNGVILITTKRGKEGKVTTTYSGYVTIQRPTNMPEPVAAWEYLQAELNSWDNAGITVTETQREQQLKLIEEQRTLKPDNWNRYDTNWKEETLKDNAIMHSHNVTISGGTDKLSFFASGSYMGQEGLIPNDEYNRTNIRLNADAKLTSWMKVGIETNLRQSELTNPGMGSPKSIINQALYMLPTLSAARELDGNWGYGKNGLNPTAMANASGEKKTRSTEALVNGTITLTPIKGLELKGQYSRRQVVNRSRSLTTPYTTSLKGQVMGTYPAEDGLNESWNQTIRNYYLAQGSYP